MKLKLVIRVFSFTCISLWFEFSFHECNTQIRKIPGVQLFLLSDMGHCSWAKVVGLSLPWNVCYDVVQVMGRSLKASLFLSPRISKTIIS